VYYRKQLPRHRQNLEGIFALANGLLAKPFGKILHCSPHYLRRFREEAFLLTEEQEGANPFRDGAVDFFGLEQPRRLDLD